MLISGMGEDMRGVTIGIALLALAGCAGLEQFPETTTDYTEALNNVDKDYGAAVTASELTPAKAKNIRNGMIDRRLRVIDFNFAKFQRDLAQENVTADFGVAVAQVIVGGTGALVSETASQILSATSGGLAGAQQAYAKSALFDQAMPALLAQMVAARKAVLVNIHQGRKLSADDYPISAAVQDLQAYEFAGSIPGAVVATSADAKVKNDAAEARLNDLRNVAFSASPSADRIEAFVRPPDGAAGTPVNAANAAAVRKWMDNLNDPLLPSGTPVATFLASAEFETLRQQMIRQLNIP